MCIHIDICDSGLLQFNAFALQVVLLFPRQFWPKDADMFGRAAETTAERGDFFLFYSYADLAGECVPFKQTGGSSHATAHLRRCRQDTSAMSEDLTELPGRCLRVRLPQSRRHEFYSSPGGGSSTAAICCFTCLLGRRRPVAVLQVGRCWRRWCRATRRWNLRSRARRPL